MKKLVKKFSLVLTVVLTTAGMYANTADFSLMVKKETGKTVRFALNTTEKTDLSIYDSEHAVVYSEKIEGKSNSDKMYNLGALPNGTYFLEADSAVRTVRYEITIDKNNAMVSEKPVVEVYKPTLVHQNGMVTLSILNFAETPVHVTIYDANGTEWYEGTFEGKVNFFKKFDLSQIPSDDYTFDITYNGRNFANTVVVK